MQAKDAAVPATPEAGAGARLESKNSKATWITEISMGGKKKERERERKKEKDWVIKI